MRRLFRGAILAIVALGVYALIVLIGARVAQAAPDPCATGPCKVVGAAVRLTVPLPPPGQFSGKWELVPLFKDCVHPAAKPASGHAGQKCPVMNNGHQFLALRNTIYFRRPNGELLAMPAGMHTDEASTPSIVWSVLPPDGPYGEASQPHDRCYASRGSFESLNKAGAVIFEGRDLKAHPKPYTRAECDTILDEGMVALHVSTWRRWVIYAGVRVGGSSGFGS